MSSNEDFLIIDNISKRFDDVVALDKVSVKIKRSELFSLLGSSGCGKSTLLRIIAGFEKPDEGRIILDGQDITDLPPYLRPLNIMFQNYALFPHMTVGENLAFPLKVRKMEPAKVEEKVRKVLDMVQMLAFIDRKPAQLSGGQQQRIALARALVFEPELVLMDEPLGALDKQLREHMQYEIKHIHENLGVTVVYVTHDQSEALTMSNRIAVFDDGIIQQLADPVTLYEKPDNAFVAQFIGENNRLNGTVESVAKSVATVKLDSGHMVKALSINNDGKGSRTMLSVRPERCVVSAKKSSSMSMLDARIEELIYLGDHIRCRMNVAGDDQFIVKVPNTSGQLGLEIGANLYVGWKTEDCRALDFRQQV
ncbi:MAG: ABC transporter ATP-binding protein [Proteobacteria bacterium]|nr:ABC transporter ATP-binding protein [Pseudomonadota bacterium]